jgi:hypothetical protein
MLGAGRVGAPNIELHRTEFLGKLEFIDKIARDFYDDDGIVRCSTLLYDILVITRAVNR